MKGLILDNSQFSVYAKKKIKELKLLETFVLPKKKQWKVNIDNYDKFIEELLNYKNAPAVYYFTVDKKYSEPIHHAFLKHKGKSSELRKSSGYASSEFLNISHVPKSFTRSNCIYAGSVKHNLHHRIKEHLGVRSNRIGGLFLSQILKTFSTKPEIIFHYYFLDKKYFNITEHIECVFQDALNPFIGKRAFRLDKEFIK